LSRGKHEEDELEADTTGEKRGSRGIHREELRAGVEGGRGHGRKRRKLRPTKGRGARRWKLREASRDGWKMKAPRGEEDTARETAAEKGGQGGGYFCKDEGRTKKNLHARGRQ
jgi:hypothetical protein